MTMKEKATLIQKALIAAAKTNTLAIKVVLHVYLEDEEPLISKIAECVGVSAPAISRTVDNLEKRGLLKRRRDETDDRRHVYITLTNRGAIFIEKLMAE